MSAQSPQGTPVKQILVAGVGNAWLQDDAFGGECRAAPGGAAACPTA